MRTRAVIAVISGVIISLSFASGYAASAPPEKGSTFPAITLPMPEKDSDKAYLGLSGKGSFALADVKAAVVIVEIMSMYCPYCQKEAPLVNELFGLIERDPSLKEKVKIIGIGAGNTPFEVSVFRNQYSVPFPIIEDPAFTVHKQIGEVRTPYFFVLHMNADRTNRILYSRVGSIEDPARFLDLIRREASLK